MDREEETPVHSFEFAQFEYEQGIARQAEELFSQEGRIDAPMQEIYHPSGDVIGYEENPISLSDLPVIDADEEETWEAERKYEEMKRKAI
ncbi:hypothetical protein M0R72_19180 [Candidatus Pacearchaeota archaeon]|jgi:hypothetical protein|nr:hypothetical protein [Candidatus Pacearchaeota archaeon]